MTTQKIPGLDAFQERQFNNLRQRHIGAAIKNAEEIQRHARLVLDRLNSGRALGSLNAQTILTGAAELAQRLAILEELDEVAGILDAGTLPPLTATHQGRAIDARDNIPAGEPQ